MTTAYASACNSRSTDRRLRPGFRTLLTNTSCNITLSSKKVGHQLAEGRRPHPANIKLFSELWSTRSVIMVLDSTDQIRKNGAAELMPNRPPLFAVPRRSDFSAEAPCNSFVHLRLYLRNVSIGAVVLYASAINHPPWARRHLITSSSSNRFRPARVSRRGQQEITSTRMVARRHFTRAGGIFSPCRRDSVGQINIRSEKLVLN